MRAFSEQVFVEEDGSLRLKTAEDGEMNSTIFQNPPDQNIHSDSDFLKEHLDSFFEGGSYGKYIHVQI